jgi:hypothetical protein
MQVDYDTYKTQDFTCSKCGWKGKGEELENGEFSEVHVIGDLECPKCYHLIAFWQGKMKGDLNRKDKTISKNRLKPSMIWQEKIKTDLNKQDQILSTIGLERIMVWQPPNYFSVYDKSKFKSYVTPDYRSSQVKDLDEIYRMSDTNIIHLESGLRLTLTITEDYFGETEEYKVIRMFIITSSGKELEVMDANFENEIFYTTDLEIPFAETNKLI